MADINEETFLEKLTWLPKYIWTDKIKIIISETIDEVINNKEPIFKKLYDENCIIKNEENKLNIYSEDTKKHYLIDYSWFYKKEKKEN